MPNTQRTPPKSPKKTLKEDQLHFTPDVFTSSSNKSDNNNITIRNSKRTRSDITPTKLNMAQSSCGCADLKDELLLMLKAWKTDNDVMLSSWRSNHDSILAGLAKDVCEVKKQCEDMRKTYIELDKSMIFFNEHYEEVNKKIHNLESQKNENHECIKRMDQQIQDIQLSTRSAIVELRNIPWKENEKYEDLLSIVCSIGKSIQMEICEKNIRDIYRLPGRQGTPRTIIAEFSTVPCRNDFLFKVRQFNRKYDIGDKMNTSIIGFPGEKKPIYIAEHITTAMRKLFYESRAFAKSRKHTCWYRNGKIFLRQNPEDKPTPIKTDVCLSAYINKY